MKKTTGKKANVVSLDGNRGKNRPKKNIHDNPSSMASKSYKKEEPVVVEVVEAGKVEISEELEALLRSRPDWPERAGAYFAALEGELGRGNILRACKVAHFSPSTVFRWRDRDPSFDKAHRKYKTRGDRLQKAALEETMDMIAGNPYGKFSQPSVTASIVRLKRLDPEYKEGGAQISIQNNNIPPRLLQAMNELLSLNVADRDRLLGRTINNIPKRISIGSNIGAIDS